MADVNTNHVNIEDNHDPIPSFLRLRHCLITILFGMFVGGLVIGCQWLLFIPSNPDIQVDSLSLSNLSLSNASITGNWNLLFSLTYPTKDFILAYHDVASSIFYKGELISQTQLPPFNQRKRNRTAFLKAAFSANDTNVHAWVVNDIDGDRKRGTVSFNVTVSARVVFRGWWRKRNRLLSGFCDGVAVGFWPNTTSSGNLVGGPSPCSSSGVE